jgi:sterol desaturase/sphingolipid hydroxylase (fatty acid hydroxylase superfamily)
MINIIASILAYDIWFYISHILLHTKMLYPYHKLHHTNSEPTFLDTYVGHSFEGPFQSIGMFVPYCFFQYTTTETIIILIVLNLRGMAQHDKRGAFLVGNHHMLHHKYSNYNYGQYWIDALCQTAIVKRQT